MSLPASPNASTGAIEVEGRILAMGLLAIQAVIGYEWLVSGITKLSSDFIPTFGLRLPEAASAAPRWFLVILDNVVAPAPTFWAVFASVTELLLGIALLGTAALLMWRFHRLPRLAHLLFLGVSGLAALAATVLAISLHVLNGATHPWLLPGDPFDEGVDLDSLLPAIQTVIFIVSLLQLRQLRRRARTHDAMANPKHVEV
ncbi:hypothetical protein [Pseudolysinimonas yzui]|uniref:Uncharacterized protein n=1 Tax=Pseudolysinimonas yzui TaxID=2708254 RepID=A0A8J3LZE3_9MICO|nr:hypothetical protein [Pseudolysinimonas yzui]GHF12809.1 hypothetical protein GCM10011600_11990 [Pseudolysinimonas yzui]